MAILHRPATAAISTIPSKITHPAARRRPVSTAPPRPVPPTPNHLKALIHGLLSLEANKLDPVAHPFQPQLFASTNAFLRRLESHRLTQASHENACPGCQGVENVLSFFEQKLAVATKSAADEAKITIAKRAFERLKAAWNPSVQI